MWVALALVAALGSASTSLVLKRAVEHGGVVVSTVAFRAVGGLLLVAIMVASSAATGQWPAPTPAYWRTVALVMPPEVAGMVFMSLALRAGELSLVQPMFGLLPLFVMAGGALFLREVPTPLAGAGVLLVAAGVYCVGLRGGGSVWEPLRALGRSRASWYALAAALVWSVTAVLHKIGIAQVGALPWAVTLTLGSALALAASLPVLAWRTGRIGLPGRLRPWAGLVALAGALFAVQQTGLQLAIGATQTSYAVAVASTSILAATVLGVVLLGERSAARPRIVGALLVTAGAVLIAVFG